MKTNKSFTKRLKITRNGKVLARKPGQNHFNAKESREKQMAKSGFYPVTMTKKAQSRFLPKTEAGKTSDANK